jgi:flagellar export protein FliJ
MAISKALGRLLRIRALEEEQRRAELESAMGELETLKRALKAAGESQRQGIARVGASAVSGAIVDRQAALVDTQAARRRAQALAPRIAVSEQEAAGRRQDFLEKRMERRQAGTLVEEAETREEIESDRRSQRAVDDWYAARRHRPDEDDRSE